MRAIDIHAHLTPQCFWRATDNGGDWHTLRRERDAQGTEFAVVGSHRQPLPPRARWTPEERLADMDSLGVDVHVVSPYVGFYNYHLDTPVAVATSRATNDEISEMVRARPQRFAGLGTLPMQDVKASIAEMERVMTRLGLKGIEINDHVNGRTLDEPEFRPFFKAAEQMGAVLFYHPQPQNNFLLDRIPRHGLNNSLGVILDDAIVASVLICGGIAEAAEPFFGSGGRIEAIRPTCFVGLPFKVTRTGGSREVYRSPADGRWCHPATLYTGRLRRSGGSRAIRHRL